MMACYLVAKHVVCEGKVEDWFLISSEKDLWSPVVTYAESFDPCTAGRVAAKCGAGCWVASSDGMAYTVDAKGNLGPVSMELFRLPQEPIKDVTPRSLV